MDDSKCKRPQIIKDKFISSLIGSFGISLVVAYSFSITSFSVYITSYIHEKQKFVSMYYGLFFNLINSISMTFGMSFAGFLELKVGFYFTNLIALSMILISNVFFYYIQNIWITYMLLLLMATGSGMVNSLTSKNIVLYKPNKKALIVSLVSALKIILGGILSIEGEKNIM